MHDCSSCLDGWQPGGRAWAIFQGFIQKLSLLPLLLFPSVQDSLECHHQSEECHAWLPLRRISNPTPCTGWRRCFKNKQHSFPKSQIFHYCIDLILQFKPQCLFMLLGNSVKASLVQPLTLLYFISQVLYVKRRRKMEFI